MRNNGFAEHPKLCTSDDKLLPGYVTRWLAIDCSYLCEIEFPAILDLQLLHKGVHPKKVIGVNNNYNVYVYRLNPGWWSPVCAVASAQLAKHPHAARITGPLPLDIKKHQQPKCFCADPAKQSAPCAL